MQKVYIRQYWEDYPSENTAVDQEHLNHIESGLDAVDNNAVLLDQTKLDKTAAAELVQEIDWDESNGTLTIIKMNGSKAVIDTKLEKLAVNFKYDPQTQQLVITLDDGTTQNVDLSTLITQYEFLDSDTVAFELTPEGKVKAIVKDGSITEDKLQPNYLADIKVEASKAQVSAVLADKSAKDSESQANLSKGYADSANEYAEKAKGYSDNLDKKLNLATFDVNEDGELIYTDNTADSFTVDDDGNLNWEVA